MCVIGCAEGSHYVGDIAAKEVLEVCKALLQTGQNGLHQLLPAEGLTFDQNSKTPDGKMSGV